LRACAAAESVLVGSFLNLDATVDFIQARIPRHLLVVCSGTADQCAYEDVLGAGALCDRLWDNSEPRTIVDSARVARRLFHVERDDLFAAVRKSRNGARLLSHAELAEDVPFCLHRDRLSLVAVLEHEQVRKLTS
jgi:2-phosphosulfolactate phosphatase